MIRFFRVFGCMIASTVSGWWNNYRRHLRWSDLDEIVYEHAFYVWMLLAVVAGYVVNGLINDIAHIPMAILASLGVHIIGFVITLVVFYLGRFFARLMKRLCENLSYTYRSCARQYDLLLSDKKKKITDKEKIDAL
jgi:hypothetical protein